MQFKIASERDIPCLTQLFHAYRQLLLHSDSLTTHEADKKWIQTRIEEGNGAFLLAYVDHELVGFLALYEGFSSFYLRKNWILSDLFVIERARGLGIGRALMEQAEIYAQASQAKSIELQITLNNKTAHILSKENGYVEKTQCKNYCKIIS